MATPHSPVWQSFSSSLCQTVRFGGEDSLQWNFTSAAGNPLVVQIAAADTFVFHRSGYMQTAAGYQLKVDGGGNVGQQFTFRPGNVFVTNTLAAGAVFGVGAGARLSLNTLTLGHGNVNKYIDADQGLVNTPSISYNATSSKWRYSHDGVLWANLGDISPLDIIEWHQTVALSIISDTTLVGLTVNGIVLEAQIRVSTQINDLDAADHHLKLGVAGTIDKYCDASQGAANTLISVNKKDYYAGAGAVETLPLILTIDGGGDNIPSSGAVEVRVVYYVQDNLPDV